jgi:beta-glucosidase
VHLEKDHAYRIKIEYFQTIRGAEARLVWGRPDEDERQAIATARNSDLVIMVLGLSARVEGEEMKVNADGFAGGDRTSIDLPAPQQQLLEHIQGIGKPTILILMNGSALGVNWADEKLPAILEAWYPGEEGGTAVAAALAGDFSPAGRLPVTFYKSVTDLPPFEDYSMAKRTYRFFDGEPLYPFGYGLSYTQFKYSNPHVDNTSVPATGTVKVSVEVANSGAVAGDEVVQLYVTHPEVAGAPLRALKGFQRIHLRPVNTRELHSLFATAISASWTSRVNIASCREKYRSGSEAASPKFDQDCLRRQALPPNLPYPRRQHFLIRGAI